MALVSSAVSFFTTIIRSAVVSRKLFNFSNGITVVSIIFGIVFGVLPFFDPKIVKESATNLSIQIGDAFLTYGSIHSIFVWSIFLTIYGTLFLYEKYHSKQKQVLEKTVNHRFDLWKLGLAAALVHISMTALNSATHFYEVLPFLNKKAVDVSAIAASIVCTLYGIFWLIWGRVSINGYWSPDIYKYQDMEIVDRGAYAYARHPIYGGQILITASIFFACDNILLAVLPVAAVVQSYKRLRAEEAALIKYSQARYKRYRESVRSTFFSIPFLS
jgi:protein-S-isoprenylcysteine O-methyltransferase Ste14